MVKIKRTSPNIISKTFSNYSHVVTAEGAQKLVFCAGQVAADVGGKVMPPDDFDAQARTSSAETISRATPVQTNIAMARPGSRSVAVGDSNSQYGSIIESNNFNVLAAAAGGCSAYGTQPLTAHAVAA